MLVKSVACRFNLRQVLRDSSLAYPFAGTSVAPKTLTIRFIVFAPIFSDNDLVWDIK